MNRLLQKRNFKLIEIEIIKDKSNYLMKKIQYKNASNTKIKHL